ncbi:lipid II flippase MurJ [Streptomyces sp. NPDC013313]|uniref:murein biosynthesis integral membrane protein MurJ n=2 Tax=unclassified Streptomyces TaxID=2593676 RepID=UPI0033E340A1
MPAARTAAPGIAPSGDVSPGAATDAPLTSGSAVNSDAVPEPGSALEPGAPLTSGSTVDSDTVPEPGGDLESSATPRFRTARDPGTAPESDSAPATGTAPGSGTARGPGATPVPSTTPTTNTTPATGTTPASTATPGTTTPRFLARAALVTASLSVAGALLGLVRDQTLAQLFGAGRDTDAFLVAWTVPEFAATLLIEEGLAFALIPAFSAALARRAQGAPGDPVRALVAGSLPRLSLAFAAVGALCAAAAPQLVGVLAPGLPDPALAVDCTRLTATCVLSFGLAGYCSAALRAHGRYLAPAAIYVVYNIGIVVAMFALGGRWGVRSAAFGVAAGGCLMVLVQLPDLVRRLRDPRAPRTVSGNGAGSRPVDVALMATVLLFGLCRQSQVLIERFFASQLPAGAISHLNYAQKVAQIPMMLSMMLCTVTFPVVARAIADGDTERARTRVERDLAVAACLVLLGAAAVVACAPQMVHLLFQRGAFTAADTAATADVMRVYALGLLGQTLTGVLVRSYFSAGRPTWYPLAAMAAGITVTSGIGAGTIGRWGVTGIAAANAAGITVTSVLLLAGMASRSVPVRVRGVLRELSRPLAAAAVAALAGAFAAGLPAVPLAGLLAGGTTVTVVFVLLGHALGAQGCTTAVRFVRTLAGRLAHAVLR